MRLVLFTLALAVLLLAFFRVNPLTWLGFRVYVDREVGRLLEEAGFSASIREPRPAERIAIGKKR